MLYNIIKEKQQKGNKIVMFLPAEIKNLSQKVLNKYSYLAVCVVNHQLYLCGAYNSLIEAAPHGAMNRKDYLIIDTTTINK